ncbi:MAG: O-antigen ligase family protein, partial [Planctomycetota bacterium]
LVIACFPVRKIQGFLLMGIAAVVLAFLASRAGIIETRTLDRISADFPNDLPPVETRWSGVADSSVDEAFDGADESSSGPRLTNALPADGRWAIFADAIRASWGYFPFGSGLGTYRFAVLPFAQAGTHRWAAHAENIFFEWFSEVGFVFLAGVAILFIGLRRRLNRLRSSVDPMDRGIWIAGCFGLVAGCVSQFFDFGILQSSNALLATILLALVWQRGQAINDDNQTRKGRIQSFFEDFLAADWVRQRLSRRAQARAEMVINASGSVVTSSLRLLLVTALLGSLYILSSDYSTDETLRNAEESIASLTKDDERVRVLNVLQTHRNEITRAIQTDVSHPSLRLIRAKIDARIANERLASAYRTTFGLSVGDAAAIADPRVFRQRHHTALNSGQVLQVGTMEKPAIELLRATRDDLEKAIQFNPLNDLAWHQLCLIDYSTGEAERFERRLKFLAAYEGRTAKHSLVTAELALQAGQYETANRLIRAAIIRDVAVLDLVIGQQSFYPISASQWLPLPESILFRIVSAELRQPISQVDTKLLETAAQQLADRPLSTKEMDLQKRINQKLKDI